MSQTNAEAIGEEGLLNGRAEGHAEGHAEGRAEGELEVARRLFRQLLVTRFGTVPEKVLQQIATATDVERLTFAVLSTTPH